MSNSSTKRVQVNVDKNTVERVDKIISAMGLTPTTVINALYNKISATGEIPFSLKLTPAQMANIDLQDALKKLPVHKVKTKTDLEKFFDDEDE